MLVLTLALALSGAPPEPSPEMEPGRWVGSAEVGGSKVESYPVALCLKRAEPALPVTIPNPQARCRELARERAADGSWRGRLACDAEGGRLDVDTAFRPGELSFVVSTAASSQGAPAYTLRTTMRREGSCPASAGSAGAAVR